MKKINFIKFSLDIIMGIVFALLFNKMVLGGLVFHEVAGTAIGAAFIIHMALNYRWIKQVTLKVFSRKISVKTRIGYIVDILLLVCMIITIVSGIAISKVLFTGFNLGNSMILKVAHVSVPYISLILIGIHLALHWVWVMNVFKKIFKITPGKKSLNYIAKFLVVIVLAFGSYNIYSTNYFSRVSSVTRIFSTSQMPGGDMKQGAPLDKRMDSTARAGQGSQDSQAKKDDPNTQDSQVKKDNQKLQDSQMKNSGQGPQNGQMPNSDQAQKRPEGNGRPSHEGAGFSANPLSVVSSNLGIIAVFIIIPYYIEKLLLLKKARRNFKVINS